MAVKSPEYAKARYLAGVKAVGGARAYRECGERVTTGGVMAVAECMKGLKAMVSEDTWAEHYEMAYRGTAYGRTYAPAPPR
ncbi:hypothetical protein DRJ16_02680 [Candidatus Woesearchaeota archaeon]|nr:MAG: hypothetical protein DRJ16_02680 [Candidatus Woesearchaeota archaeon]